MKKSIYYFTILTLIICFNHCPVRCENKTFSMINIYVINNSIKKSPTTYIWFNDSLIHTKDVTDNYNLRYKMFSKGNLKISAQLGDFVDTRTEYSLNVLNDSCYNLIIQFDAAKFPGSIFQVKKIDGINYEPYFEESINNEDIINREFNTQNNSSSQLIIRNDSWKFFATVKLWINDQLIIKNILSSTSRTKLYCNLFAEGKVKITAQLGNFVNTKTEQEFEISNLEINYISITFINKNEEGTISLLDKEEGLNLLPTYIENWTLQELTDLNSDMLEESITNPIPHMFDNNTYSAFLEQSSKNESLITETKNYNYNTILQDSIDHLVEIDKNSNTNEELDDIKIETIQKGYIKPEFNDIIVRKNGETIECNITKEDDENIYFNLLINDQKFSTFLNRNEIKRYKLDAIQAKPFNIHFTAAVTPLSFLVLGPTITGELVLGPIGFFSGYRNVSMGLINKNLVYGHLDLSSSSYTTLMALRFYNKSNEDKYLAIYTEFGKFYRSSGEKISDLSIYGLEYGKREHLNGIFTLEASLTGGVIIYKGEGIISMMRYPYISINIRLGFIL